MTRTIWKFPLDRASWQQISIPGDAKILSVGMQANVIYLWAIVNPDLPQIQREVAIIGTGQLISDALEEKRFVGTVFDGPFVWHVFIQEE